MAGRATQEGSGLRRDGSHLVATADTTGRLEALTDGVFAIVMTLMVFDIRVPAAAPEGLAAALAELWPKFFAYGVSFVQLGIYWTGHRAQCNFLRREDHTLRWIALLFLALVALVPFSTQLLGDFLVHRLALAVYAANVSALSLVLCWHWLHATNGRRLVEEGLEPAVVSTGVRRCLTAPLLYALALALSLVTPVLTVALFALVPAFYVFPVLIDRLWFVRHEEASSGGPPSSRAER